MPIREKEKETERERVRRGTVEKEEMNNSKREKGIESVRKTQTLTRGEKEKARQSRGSSAVNFSAQSIPEREACGKIGN